MTSEKYVPIVKIEGLKVFFEDGDVLKKDVNNIWMYRLFLDSQTSPWENRIRFIDETGKMILVFPPF